MSFIKVVVLLFLIVPCSACKADGNQTNLDRVKTPALIADSMISKDDQVLKGQGEENVINIVEQNQPLERQEDLPIEQSKARTSKSILPQKSPKSVNEFKSDSSEIERQNISEKILDSVAEILIEKSPDTGALIAERSITIDTYVDKLDAFLQKYVSNSGDVDYAAINNNRDILDQVYKEMIAGPTSTKTNEALAYWINLYNISTIKLIINHFPVNSIMEIDNGKAWDRKWITVDGQKLSLNDIEHEIIRKQFKDPRIHFAVNCAAASCPPLLNEAYKGRSLDQQLETVTRKFINNQSYNQINSSTLQLSKIFEWYADDFGNIPDFIQQYVDIKIEGAEVSFVEYIWELNSK